jgi:hypothetical protein
MLEHCVCLSVVKRAAGFRSSQPEKVINAHQKLPSPKPTRFGLLRSNLIVHFCRHLQRVSFGRSLFAQQLQAEQSQQKQYQKASDASLPATLLFPPFLFIAAPSPVLRVRFLLPLTCSPPTLVLMPVHLDFRSLAIVAPFS